MSDAMTIDPSTPPWDITPADALDGPCIIIYRPHGKMQCETQYYGPFDHFDLAYDALDTLPAIGINTVDAHYPGCKFIQPLRSPL